ncbi:phytoene desaturase family protein [Anaerophaga thermohalophila]|uniref:phytoene desaturase family protein n=1 Tax=Anaerophaga thermohalophila TaxID=177400 RepID=UPI0003076440|nr:phytoene desaturase family protein [Anaerophaga thermohalophila]
MSRILITGTGLGGLATALRLTSSGHKVVMVEKFHQPGGRLNRLSKDGFTFDMGPSFFSMSYEFHELARSCNWDLPFEFQELEPLYSVNFSDTGRTFRIFKNPQKLAEEFAGIEADLEKKLNRYLQTTGALFHDTEDLIIRRNFNHWWEYLQALMQVPPKHGPRLFRSFWNEVSRYFESREVKEILSLVAFFLGGTPFDTPAVFTMLSYTELKHDGYYNVRGGMYRIVEELVNELKKGDVEFHFNTEISDFDATSGQLKALIDTKGNRWEADQFVVNADAALFRGKVLRRRHFRIEKLDEMRWTMAPLTIYLGVKGKIPGIYHHNYFLGGNFRDYAKKLFRNQVSLEKPYYYVNVLSRHNPESAPEGHESLFILVPVPDLRFRPDWSDRDEITESILRDLSVRIGFDLIKNRVTQTVFSPQEWEKMFDLHRGSGLGLGHNMLQMGYLRPSNRDEKFSNLFYTGASTTPGTGLPMVVISSKLTVEQMKRA